MPPMEESFSRMLTEVRERAATERDPEKLGQLILAINALLDVIEKRVAEINGYRLDSSN